MLQPTRFARGRGSPSRLRWPRYEGLLNVASHTTYETPNPPDAPEMSSAQAPAAASESEQAQAALPFLGDDIFVLIATKLDARMLGRLGCVAQRFWRPSVPDPAHTAEDAGAAELWSVAEEGARRRLCAQGEQVRGWVCRGGVGGSWLRALGEAEKLQRPVVFTARHEDIELGEEGTVATNSGDSYDWRSAVCGGHEMRRGRHYATFTLRDAGVGDVAEAGFDPSIVAADLILGVVGAGFDPISGAEANMSAQGWMLRSLDGSLWHAGRISVWEGQPQWTRLKHGDVVVRLAPRRTPACLSLPELTLCALQGLLLDCDAATLTVWVNGERKGVMARPGMTDDDGEPVGRLEGPLRWAVDLDGAVKIDGPLPLPEDA